MKTIIAGSRNITDPSHLSPALQLVDWEITEIISGGARGVDRLAINLAKYGDIPLEVFPADWDQYGRSAGVIRNREMAQYADALLAIWDGDSTGTQNMIQEARNEDLLVEVYIVD